MPPPLNAPLSLIDKTDEKPKVIRAMPLAPWPCYTQEEIDAVTAVISSGKVNYWTGNRSRQFETDFAIWSGSRKAVALSNGTLALDLALVALGIGPGDEVVVTPRTFIASVSCVVNAGATPVFADVDIDSGNISPETIEAVLTRHTRAIIPVHLAGWPCDMNGIMSLANQRGISVIEDCAQAHGAKIDGKSVGTLGHVGAWSFCQDKIMTTGGEGGMVTTDDDALWSRMWSFKDHGKDWNAVYNGAHPPGFRWLHESFGTNWRMLEVQAAIGLVQLRRMDEWTKQRKHNAAAVRKMLNNFQDAVRTPEPDSSFTHAYYRQYAYVLPTGLRAGWDRDRIVAEANARGAALFQGSCSEVYREKAFDGTPWRPSSPLPTAKELGETSLMFLTHPTISDDQRESMTDTIAEVLAMASK